MPGGGLQVEGAEEEDRDHEAGPDEQDDGSGQHRASRHQDGVDQGLGVPTQPRAQREEQHQADSQGGEGAGRGDPGVAGVDAGEDDRSECQRAQQRADQVEACPGRERRQGGQHCGQRDQDGRPDWDVDQEHPGPAGAGGEHAPDEDADRRADAAQGRPDPQRPVEFLAGEQAHDGRQGCGGHQGRAHALGHAGGEDERGVVG